MIDSLKPDEVFVFGSNMNGDHAGGAARQAKEQFGAVDGVGEGLTGQCYAFPTLGYDMEKRSSDDLYESKMSLYQSCIENPERKFLLTKVGCGIAGYREDYMKSLFTNDHPGNLVLPEDWE